MLFSSIKSFLILPGFLFIDISTLLIHYFFFIFFTSSFSSLSIFKIVVLKSLSSRSTIRSFSGMVLVGLYFFIEWAIFFCSFTCLLILVKNWTFESNMVTLEIRFFSFPRVCYFLLFLFYLCCRLSLYQGSA